MVEVKHNKTTDVDQRLKIDMILLGRTCRDEDAEIVQHKIYLLYK